MAQEAGEGHDRPKSALGEMTLEARLLLQELQKAEPGEMLSYERLSEVAGCDVQYRGRAYLNTARNRVERDRNVVTQCVRGEGVKILDPAGISEVACASVKHIHNAARTARRRLGDADFTKMDPTSRVNYFAAMSLVNMVASATTATSTKKLYPHVQDRTLALPVGTVLQELSK